jgi:hypothetical protein
MAESAAQARVISEFRRWNDGRLGISRLYEEIVAGIIEDPEVQTLLTRAMPIPLLCNRFMASVHFLLLQGTEAALSGFYQTVSDPAKPPDGCYPQFREFCLSRATALLELTRCCEVQINEVRRSAAFLYALNQVEAVRAGSSIGVVEAGACAGFNLNLDHYSYDFGGGVVGDPKSALSIRCEMRGGEPLPSISIPRVGHKAGIDVAPLDVAKAADRNWLIAFASPDDEPRQRYIRRAIEETQRHPVVVHRGSAGDLLGRVMEQVPEHLHLCVLHAMTQHHFGVPERDRVRQELTDASKGRDITVIGFEWPCRGGSADMGSELQLTLTVYASGRAHSRLLARSDRRGSAEWLHPVRSIRDEG